MLLLWLSTWIRALKQALCRTITESPLAALTNPPVIANNCSLLLDCMATFAWCLAHRIWYMKKPFLFAFLQPPSNLFYWKSQARAISLEGRGRQAQNSSLKKDRASRGNMNMNQGGNMNMNQGGQICMNFRMQDSNLRRFLLLTLTDLSGRESITKTTILERIQKCFSCSSIIVTQEGYPEKGQNSY